MGPTLAFVTALAAPPAVYALTPVDSEHDAVSRTFRRVSVASFCAFGGVGLVAYGLLKNSKPAIAAGLGLWASTVLTINYSLSKE